MDSFKENTSALEEIIKNDKTDEDVEDDDDIPQLSADTLAVLQDFYKEQEAIRELLEGTTLNDTETLAESNDKNQNDSANENETNKTMSSANKLFSIEMGKSFPEDWQLSQFWYDDDTSNILANEVLNQAGSDGKVACISCPSIFRACGNAPNVTLFEYDKRFRAFGSLFHFYDYNKPEDIPESCLAAFTVVVADPPFLSEECLEKVAVTVKKLITKKGKIMLCTGSVMEPVADRVLNLKRTSFIPQHKHNLGNEFACYTNYEVSLIKKS